MQIIIIFSFAFFGTLLAAEAHTALIPGPAPGSSFIIEKGVALGQFQTLRTPRTDFTRFPTWLWKREALLMARSGFDVISAEVRQQLSNTFAFSRKSINFAVAFIS